MKLFTKYILSLIAILVVLGVGCQNNTPEITVENINPPDNSSEVVTSELYPVIKKDVGLWDRVTFTITYPKNYYTQSTMHYFDIYSPELGEGVDVKMKATERITISIINTPPVDMSLFENCDVDSYPVSCSIEDGWYSTSGGFGGSFVADTFRTINNGQEYFIISEKYLTEETVQDRIAAGYGFYNGVLSPNSIVDEIKSSFKETL